MQEKDNDQKFIVKLAAFIVDKRSLFFLIFGLLIIASIVGLTQVKVENDITAYLPETSETRQGLDVMRREFITYGSCKLMIENISFARADIIAEEISELPYVSLVQFDDTGSHYSNFSALINVTFIHDENDPRCLEYIARLEEMLSGEDLSVSTTLGDQMSRILADEVSKIIVYVAIIVVAVLLFTCTSFAEVPVLLITFLVSAILAMGSNFLLGTISFVSNSVAIVLQLALSVDYAVIFCNRYKEEHRSLDSRSADIIALSKAIPEISASSLTTVGGLAAMLFMQFGIGPDLGIVLIKAIILSLVSVFFLMPGLIMLFAPLMDKTTHKNLVPRIDFAGSFAYKSRRIMPLVFVLVIAVAYKYQSQCPFVYGETLIDTVKKNETQLINNKIRDYFGSSNALAVMVPAGDYEKESALIKDLEARKEVKSVTGIANTEARNGVTLARRLNAREFAELLDLDREAASLLYAAYAINDENYAKLISGFSTYNVALIDMFGFLYEEVQGGFLELDEETEKEIEDANSSINVAKDQLQGPNFSRLLVDLELPEEGPEVFAFLDEVKELVREHYGEEAEFYFAGNATSNYDLCRFFERDTIVVNVISILTVLVVLLFTFKSCGMPLLLILVIEGCIWMNFAVPAAKGNYLFFLSYLVVSSIQMGANIDYAIVVSSRFQEVKQKMDTRAAITDTINFAFPTIITSGTMLASAGILIGRLTSMASICGVGECTGRGTIISIFAVLFVLPQLLLVGDKIIDKTSFAVSLPVDLSSRQLSGYTMVDGVVSGYINGYFTGSLKGMIRGDADLVLRSGNCIPQEDHPQQTGPRPEDDRSSEEDDSDE